MFNFKSFNFKAFDVELLLEFREKFSVWNKHLYILNYTLHLKPLDFAESSKHSCNKNQNTIFISLLQFFLLEIYAFMI